MRWIKTYGNDKGITGDSNGIFYRIYSTAYNISTPLNANYVKYDAGLSRQWRLRYRQINDKSGDVDVAIYTDMSVVRCQNCSRTYSTSSHVGAVKIDSSAFATSTMTTILPYTIFQLVLVSSPGKHVLSEATDTPTRTPTANTPPIPYPSRTQNIL